MRKYTITCKCGQRMLVPRSAIGKRGMCPSCGDSVDIGSDSIERQQHRHSTFLRSGSIGWEGGGSVSSDEARQRFGKAVDLFYASRYAESLAIFDLLARQFPGNTEVASGRAQCAAILNRQALPGASATRARLPLPEGANLDTPTIKRVVLDIMMHGSTSEVRLQAAELACKLLGLVPNGVVENDKPDEGHEGEEEPSLPLSDAGQVDMGEKNDAW